MIVLRQLAAIRRMVVLVIPVLLALAVVGCASGPLGSHGVDYIPAFDAPFAGKGG